MGGPFKPSVGLSGASLPSRYVFPTELSWALRPTQVDQNRCCVFPRTCHPDRSVPGFPTSPPSTAATYAALRKREPHDLHRSNNSQQEIGGAEWRDLRFHFRLRQYVFRQSEAEWRIYSLLTEILELALMGLRPFFFNNVVHWLHFHSGCSERLRVFPSGSLNQATRAPVGEVQIPDSSGFKNS